MVVYRGGQRIGRIRVSTVGYANAEAKVVSAPYGIRPEDRARAVVSATGPANAQRSR